MMELCRQQVRLGLLRAARVLLKHQNVLRQVLLQPVLPELAHPEPEPSTGDDETVTETTDYPNLILQHILVSATQPSPLKALFTREEMEVIINSQVVQHLIIDKIEHWIKRSSENK